MYSYGPFTCYDYTLAFGGIYFWFPKFTGRMYNEKIAKAAFWLILIGAIVAFVPMFKLGLMGMPRRYWSYPAEFTGTYRVVVIGGLEFMNLLGTHPIFLDINTTVL